MNRFCYERCLLKFRFWPEFQGTFSSVPRGKKMFMWRNVVMRVCAIVEVYVYEMMSLVDFFFWEGAGLEWRHTCCYLLSCRKIPTATPTFELNVPKVRALLYLLLNVSPFSLHPVGPSAPPEKDYVLLVTLPCIIGPVEKKSCPLLACCCRLAWLNNSDWGIE